MGKKKRKDLIEENENLTNTDVGFGEMAIQQTITSWSDIAYNTAAIGAKLDRDPDDSKEETDHGRVHTLEAEVNEVNNRFGTLDANQNNRFDALEAKMDRLSALEVKMDYFMLQFSGQQNTAAAGGFGQGVQFSGQQRTATPAAGGLGQEVQFSGQQRTAIPAADGPGQEFGTNLNPLFTTPSGPPPSDPTSRMSAIRVNGSAPPPKVTQPTGQVSIGESVLRKQPIPRSRNVKVSGEFGALAKRLKDSMSERTL